MISSMGGYRCCHIQFWNMVIMEKEKRYVGNGFRAYGKGLAVNALRLF